MSHPNCACLVPLLAEDLGGPGVDKNAANLTADTQLDSIHRVRPLQKLDTESLAAGNDGERLGQRFGRADQPAALVLVLNEKVIAVIRRLIVFIDLGTPAKFP